MRHFIENEVSRPSSRGAIPCLTFQCLGFTLGYGGAFSQTCQSNEPGRPEAEVETAREVRIGCQVDGLRSRPQPGAERAPGGAAVVADEGPTVGGADDADVAEGPGVMGGGG